MSRHVPLDDVGRALGMDSDKLLRYRQRGGLLDGVGETYSEAWE